VKRPLTRPRRTREDNNRMDLRNIEWEILDWVRLTQDRGQRQDLVNTTMNLRVP